MVVSSMEAMDLNKLKRDSSTSTLSLFLLDFSGISKDKNKFYVMIIDQPIFL